MHNYSIAGLAGLVALFLATTLYFSAQYERSGKEISALKQQMESTKAELRGKTLEQNNGHYKVMWEACRESEETLRKLWGMQIQDTQKALEVTKMVKGICMSKCKCPTGALGPDDL
jgi:hypothetical protein